ncbi:MAG: putative ABC transporter ATP-binding protein [Firmicutes bacterium ADurb.Bin248]|nr:MAG: putative ABC transporter ATP-binding protein [Firmicutes bacterium ADurb.Bin248]
MNIYKKYFGRYKTPFFTGVFCVAMEATCDLLGPTIMAKIINEGIERANAANVLFYGRWMLLVTFLGALFAVSRNMLASRVSQRLGADLRFDLFSKIMRFSEHAADEIQSGSLITRLTNDVQQVTQFVNGTMRIFFKAPVTCVGSIVLATLLNPGLSFIMYAVVAIVALGIIVSMRLSYPRYAKLQQAMDRLNSVVQEYLIGVRLVKAFGTYDSEEKRFGKANDELMKRGVAAQIVITFISPIMTLAVGLGTALAIWLGAKQTAAGFTEPGDVSAFTIYMAQILTSLLMITNIFNVFVRTKASNARVREVFAGDEDFVADGAKVPAGRLPGSVEFSRVTFSYPGSAGDPVLKELSFQIGEGGTLAIIGPTGSGKSTIAWLLLRFYDADSGSVRIGGRDIREIAPALVRASVALVPQKPMLFSGSVKSNLLWGDKNASAETLGRALAIAQAGFVEDMPEGVESMLGSGGVNISGGQKQRVAIARALVKHAPVLILDDATSALDSVTEARVRRGLVENRKGTLILITQRCSTAMFADRILVLDAGRAAGIGTHAELMQSCEMYREIYRSQIESSAALEAGYGG